MFFFYAKLVLAAACGQGIQLIGKHISIVTKAKLASVPFPKFWVFVADEIRSIAGTALTIFLFLLLATEGTGNESMIIEDKTVTWWVFQFSVKAIFNMMGILLMATVGYTGMDVALRIFSVTNKRINSAIDYKTTIADEAVSKSETIKN